MNEASNFCTGHVCEVPPEGVRLGYLSPGAGAKPYFEFGTEPPRCALQCWSLEPFLKQWLLQEQMAASLGGGSKAAPSNGTAEGEGGDGGAAAASATASPTGGGAAPGGGAAALGHLVREVTASAAAAAAVAASSSTSSPPSALGQPRAWQEPGHSAADWERFMRVDAPPYAITNNNVRLPLSFRTLPVTARHGDGSLEYDAHNLYGLAQAAVTARVLARLAPQRRPFVLTRSSFLGAGAHAAHWLGDNAATWDDLRRSVTGVLEAGLYGNPLPGADVCGFLLNTTAELCGRWAAAAALQPFIRDHSDLAAGRQELYRWPETAAAARAALGVRYRLLPAWYAAAATAAATGCPAARPLWFGWPADEGALGGSDEAWLVGDGLLAAPALRPGVDNVIAYLPPGAWHDWASGGEVGGGGGGGGGAVSGSGARAATAGGATASGGRSVELAAPLTGAPPLLVAGGLALVQVAAVDAGGRPLKAPPQTTAEAWGGPLAVLAGLPAPGDPPGGAFARCGPPGPPAGSPDAPPGARIAWGRTFRDGGEDPEPAATGGWLNVVAGEEEAGGGGWVRLAWSGDGHWPAGGLGGAAASPPPPTACTPSPTGSASWPALSEVAVYGLAATPDLKTVTLSVGGGRAAKVKPKFVSFDPANRALRVRGGLVTTAKLGRCEGVSLAWKGVGGGERAEL